MKKTTCAGLFLFIFSSFMLSSCELKPAPSHPANSIPIQSHGQVISFEAFSIQTVQLITGKNTWERMPPTAILLEALHSQASLADKPWVKLSLDELKVSFGLSQSKNYFSYQELLPSFGKIESLVRSSQAKRDRDIRPSKLEQEAESLFGRLLEVGKLISGESITVIPSESENEGWASPFAEKNEFSDLFKNMLSLYGEKKQGEFSKEAEKWKARVHAASQNRYAKKMELEIRYFQARPFQSAWVLYLMAFVFLAALKQKRVFFFVGVSSLLLAFFFHSYGLVLRILILERPPVSNMYESMVFMNWVLITVAILFSAFTKNRTAVVAGSLISALVMIYGDLLPIDAGLNVLVPVLRSNYWLTIHVLTIVSSYGIFGLAMGLGHRHLILALRGKLSKKIEEESAELIQRVIQIGTLLLGIGTVLGGVWANESWGRFWGWDPKETWALITFLGYLIVIHLRTAKILKPFGLALSSVIGFLLVLMTWYGVNFVLGRGLHSYGQGSGGMIWVIVYLLLEVLFLGWVLTFPRLKMK